jgi:hypothetical protein
VEDLKMVDKVQDAFERHRRGAGYRGIPFHFTLEDWRIWWSKNLGPDWFEKRGKGPGKYVMARYGDKGPYVTWNVKCITHAENSREQIKRAKLTIWQVRAIYLHLKAGDMTQAALSKLYSISGRTLRDIKTKKTWSSVTDLLD